MRSQQALDQSKHESYYQQNERRKRQFLASEESLVLPLDVEGLSFPSSNVRTPRPNPHWQSEFVSKCND